LAGEKVANEKNVMSIKNKIIVITGATGFIGRNVAAQLLEQGAEVYALVRAESKQKDLLPKAPNMHLMTGDLAHIETSLKNENFTLYHEDNRNETETTGIQSVGTSEESVQNPAKTPKHIDIFLHFAWGGVNREEIDSPVVQQKNIDDSLTCLKAAHKYGCKLFMDAGSRVEYGVTEDGTMSEDMACHPVNAYGKAKLAFYEQAAKLCQEWKMSYDHLRYFSVYGVGDHPWSIISTLTRDLPLGKTVSLSACMHRWNFMDIEDAARAVLELIRHSDSFEGETHIVNIASEDTRRLRDFVEEIHALCGGSGSLEYGTFVQAKEGALSICPTVDVLRKLTEGTWEERVPFREGITRLLKN
jgi:nucleoside-diphosphate-sugar epimerase